LETSRFSIAISRTQNLGRASRKSGGRYASLSSQETKGEC
jgi:hypothetical protein